MARSGSRACGLGCLYGTMMSGTGEWRARPTATEPTTRWLSGDELPTMMARVSSGGLRRWLWPLRSAHRRRCPGAARTPRRPRWRAAARRLGCEAPARSRRGCFPFRRWRRVTACRGWTGELRPRRRCGRSGRAAGGPRRQAPGWREETVIPDYEMKTPWAAWQWSWGKGKLRVISCCHRVTGGSRPPRRDSIQISQIWRVQVMTCTESACAQNQAGVCASARSKADYAVCLLASGSAVLPGVLSWAGPLVAGLVRPSDVHDLDG
jgi:hypothetical protein